MKNRNIIMSRLVSGALAGLAAAVTGGVSALAQADEPDIVNAVLTDDEFVEAKAILAAFAED